MRKKIYAVLWPYKSIYSLINTFHPHIILFLKIPKILWNNFLPWTNFKQYFKAIKANLTLKCIFKIKKLLNEYYLKKFSLKLILFF